MSRWWGAMEPIAPDRIDTPLDGARIRAGGRTFQALYTPGHAIHHIAYYDEADQSLFPGDVAGVRIAGANYVRPPTPPPDLNLGDWEASADRLRRLPLGRMYLPHFGLAEGIGAHWNDLLSRLHTWGEFVLSRTRLGVTTDAIAAELAAHEDHAIVDSDPRISEGTAMRSTYEHATNYRMSVLGYERYYRKVRPDLLR
jgi:glyoxylase-like metal-dependent hydrolase (beta-lactamase superfamily II)